MGTIKNLTFLFILITGSMLSFDLSAQKITYLAPFGLETENEGAFQLIGRINSKYLLYHHAPGHEAEIICFNDSGYIEKFLSLPQIQPKITRNIGMVGREKRFTLLTQNIVNEKLYTILTNYNENGPIEEPAVVDSVRLEIYGRQGHFNIVNSPQKNFTLLYRILAGFSNTQIKIETIRLDSLGHTVGASGFYIPFQAELEMFSPPVIAENGDLFWPVYDKPYNYKLGSTVRIFQLSLQTNTPTVTELYLKENKPVEIQIRPDIQNKKIALGGLYANFYSKRLEGAFYGFAKMGAKKSDSMVWLPMDKKFKKELKSGVYSIPFDEVINRLQLRQFHVYPNGTVSILADMFNNFTGLRMMGFSNQSPMVRNRPNSASSIPAPVNAVTNTQRSGSNTTVRSLANDRASNPNPDLLSRNGGFRRTTVTGQDASSLTNQQNQRMGAETPFQPFAPAYMQETITPSNAGNILFRNKTLDYKTVVFTTDKEGFSWKKWTKNLYVPETPFTNILQIPNSIGEWQVINYEVSQKNLPYLRMVSLKGNEPVLSQKMEKPGMPFLFYKSNALLIRNNEILTIYYDPEKRQSGLALITW